MLRLNKMAVTAIFRQEMWRSRAALAGVVAVCMAATTLAVTGAGADTAGMKFLQSGHLIYNSTLGTVFHIDGGTKNVDGQLSVPGLGAGVRTVQTDTHGFMLARGSITEFGKSDLKVTDPVPAPSNEQPAALEAPGAAYAVYREAGAISRLGLNPVTLPAGGALGPPVVTADGTLWVHRLAGRELCQLPVQADRLSCPAELASGHAGALTVVGDQVVFVDTTARELRAVNADGFGRTVPVPDVPMTATSMVAPYDVNGRIAIVDGATNQLHLVDAAAVVGDSDPAAPVVKPLRPGKYSQIASSGHGLALIDSSTGDLVTLDADGKEKSVQRIPPPSPAAKPGKDDQPGLFRGADKRLYVDSVAGEHVMVVDADGGVTKVDATGKPNQTKSPKPKETTPPTTPHSVPPSSPPSTKPTQNEPKQPERTEGPGKADKKTNPPRTEQPERTEPPRTQKPPEQTTAPPKPKPTPRPTPKPKPPPVKASPAAAPTGAKATPGDQKVSLSWKRPNLNGGRLVGYSVTLNGDPESTPSTSYTWSGLTNGRRYTFQVRAVTTGTNGETLVGVAATVSATPGGAGKLSISQGPNVTKFTDSNCPEGTEDDCFYIMLNVSGFAPNTDYVFKAYSNGQQIHDASGYTLTTDGNGDLTQKKFHNSRVGEVVKVIATGPGGPYTSNSFTWQGG